jgi:hypothetical protein
MTGWRIGLALLAGALAAGCGGEQPPRVYKFGPTKACLENADARVSTRGIDFVASTALGGALNVRFPGNEVTLAFGRSDADAERIADAYARFAPRRLRPKIADVLGRERNVVLLWGVAPREEDRKTVVLCLRG